MYIYVCIHLYDQPVTIQQLTMASKSSYGRTRKKLGRYNIDGNEEELIVKCKNENY